MQYSPPFALLKARILVCSACLLALSTLPGCSSAVVSNGLAHLAIATDIGSTFANSRQAYYKNGGAIDYLKYFREVPSQGEAEKRFFEEYVKPNFSNITSEVQDLHVRAANVNNYLDAKIDSTRNAAQDSSTLHMTIFGSSWGPDTSDHMKSSYWVSFSGALRGRLNGTQDTLTIERSRLTYRRQCGTLPSLLERHA